MVTISDKEFRQLADFIKLNYGINLKEEKRALLLGRLQKVLYGLNFSSFSEYYEYLMADKTGEAIITLIDKITTNHTFFMREADHFYFFRDEVLPWLKAVSRDKDFRIWSAGCSTGEEPYTLAIILDEFLGSEKPSYETKILATDISTKVLTIAKQGIYSNDKISVLPKTWRLKYFNKLDNENSIIAEKLKGEIFYRKFNLMEEVFPFKKKFHVIFCRNVMIYFDEITKNKLVNKYYDNLENGGYLFIGHSEALNRDATKFKYISPAIYRKEL